MKEIADIKAHYKQRPNFLSLLLLGILNLWSYCSANADEPIAAGRIAPTDGSLDSKVTANDFGSTEASPANSTEPVSAELDSNAIIEQLELKLFNHAFNQEDISKRLDRIEDFALGAISKTDIDQRLLKLKKIFGKSLFETPPKDWQKNTEPLSQAKASEPNSSAAVLQERKAAQAKPEDSLLSIINQGIDNYNRHRFHNAEDDFNRALDLAPGMSRIHAYLGVTLLQLNQRQAAIDALRASYELDPFGSYGRYSKNCLITLMGDEEIRKRGPKDSLKTVERTIGSVNRSADTDSQRHNQFGAALANIRQSSGNTAASRLFSDPDGWTNQMALRQNYIRNDAFIQATRTRQDAAHRAALTQESANNLKALIASKHLPGDAKLRAFGTTLNARYYGDETYNLAPWYIPREAPLELKAKPAALKSPGKKASTAPRRRVSKKAASSGKSYRGKATGARSSYAAKRSGSKAPVSKSSKAPVSKSSKAPPSKSSKAPPSKSSKAPASKSSKAPPSKSSKAPPSKSSKAPASKSPVKASTRKN